MASKISASVHVGRRLRRYLGTLLALGFGTAWWSFTPASAAATVPAVETRASTAESASLRVRFTGMATLPERRIVKPRPPRRHKVRPPVVIDVPPVIEPVIEVPPEIALVPVLEPPIERQPPIETPPDDIRALPRIVTRSS
ncbi:MAG: hypothetical protein IPQ07_25045 [Myxococcales bacterium]|nr:hypothetical protein [Myxococcales bacterium]